MGPEEKLFLGWLEPEDRHGRQHGSYTLRAAGDPASNEAVVVNLPDAEFDQSVTTPYAGDHAWWSGSRSDLTRRLDPRRPGRPRP